MTQDTDKSDALDMDFLGDDLLLEQVQDTFVEDNGERGLKFGFVCVGQCGNNIGSALWEQGYRRVIQFNTTEHDLQANRVAKRWHHVAEGFDGAGKERSVGREAAQQSTHAVLELMQERFKSVDFIFVVTSTGGGTGSGASSVFAGVAKSYLMQSQNMSEQEAVSRVGLIAVLPKPQEGSTVAANTRAFLQEFVDPRTGKSRGHSPLVFIDNSRAASFLPKTVSIAEVNATINRIVIGIFDVFNTVTVRHSNIATFDPKDYTGILRSGIITIGVSELRRIESDVDIPRQIKTNLANTLLVDKLDVSTGTHAGFLLVAGDTAMEMIASQSVTKAQEVLNTMLSAQDTGKMVTITTGIYRQNKETVKIFTVLGGLSFPISRLEL